MIRQRVEAALPWKAAFASVRGRGHADSVCQDAAAVERRGGVLAVCVCDGAGSARLSHYGAQAVSRAVARFLCESGTRWQTRDVDPRAVIRTARKAIVRALEVHGGSPGDYACTLLGLVITGNHAVAIHLGDGVIACCERGIPRLVSGPDNGEFANQTTFVTSSRAVERVRVMQVELPTGLRSFALMTDGAEATLFDKQTWDVSRAVEAMASWLDGHSEEVVTHGLSVAIENHLLPATSDDVTVAVVRRWAAVAFVCGVCRRGSLSRGRGGKTRFRIECRTCRCVVRCETSGRGYPKLAREWAHHLLSERRLSIGQVTRVTRIPRRTLRRWLRPRRRTRSPACQ